MTEQLLHVGESFWNIRGEFKIGGVLNIGTHCSLIRRANGRYIVLDAYTLKGAVKQQFDQLTDGGEKVEAIINLHPFHTVHVRAMQQQYPGAKLYGTRRHVEKFADLQWQPELCESAEFAASFAPDLQFSIPDGVDFIAKNEHLHFSSVLAYHPASKTIHVDDTLMYLPLPGLLGKLRAPILAFHPTLSKTLQRRSGAAQEFRDWARNLSQQWADAEHICAAHSAASIAHQQVEISIAEQIMLALQKVEKSLRRHEKAFP